MDFIRTVNPNGGVVYRRAVRQMPSNNELLECIVSADNIHLAWKQVRANKGAPGIDGITVEELVIRIPTIFSMSISRQVP